MRSRYDNEADALYIRFAESPISDSEEVRPGIVLDFDAQGKVVGIEILEASEHLAGGTDFAGLAA